MSVASVGNIPISPMPHPAENIRGTVRQNDSPSQVETRNNSQLHSTAADLERTFNRKLRFVVDLDSKQVIVKVIDKETDKVIRELPPEELQRLHRNIKEAIGISFDELV